MELTRRDATAALAALGATGAVALGGRRLERGRQDGSDPRSEGHDGVGPTDEDVRAAMVAVASVVYPEAVSGIESFVEGFLEGRLDGGVHDERLRETVSELDELARSWRGGSVADLSSEEIDRLLREVGADSADEDPDGTTAERVRYYVVNELLLALYTSPRGGELVGIENPQGYPGGVESYARGS